MRVGRIALHEHPLHPPAVDEVVDVGASPTPTRIVSLMSARVSPSALAFSVDVDPVLRFVVGLLLARTAAEDRILRRQASSWSAPP